MPDEKLVDRSLAIYHRVNERCMFYLGRMWEGPRFFLTLYTVPMSASAVLLTAPFPYDCFSVPAAFAAQILALYGQRALAQDRMLFAFELQVRRKLEQSLGFSITNPRPQPMLGTRPWRRASEAISAELQYDPLPNGISCDPSKLRFDDDDRRAIADVRNTRRGIFGLLMRTYTYCLAIGMLGMVVSIYTLSQRHHAMISAVAHSIQDYSNGAPSHPLGTAGSLTATSTAMPAGTSTTIPDVGLPGRRSGKATGAPPGK